jgi:hypothetical protein
LKINKKILKKPNKIGIILSEANINDIKYIKNMIEILIEEEIKNIMIYDYFGKTKEKKIEILNKINNYEKIEFHDYKSLSKPQICKVIEKNFENIKELRDFKKFISFDEPDLIIIFSETNILHGYSPFQIKFSEFWFENDVCTFDRTKLLKILSFYENCKQNFGK